MTSGAQRRRRQRERAEGTRPPLDAGHLPVGTEVPFAPVQIDVDALPWQEWDDGRVHVVSPAEWDLTPGQLRRTVHRWAATERREVRTAITDDGEVWLRLWLTGDE